MAAQLQPGRALAAGGLIAALAIVSGTVESDQPLRTFLVSTAVSVVVLLVLARMFRFLVARPSRDRTR